MTACLDEETVLLAAMGALPVDGQAVVDGHIDECATCRRLLLLCARAGVGGRGSIAETIEEPYVARERRELARGASVDRYLVLSKLGAGAMGVVYAAHDPDLDRKIALKVLRSAEDARWLREGRAVARLSHANVIAVHDVGVADGRAFIVMELVDGESVDAWLASARAWREVLRVFVAAGRGLAAAHAAGIVHRDFKPANVLIGSDGRVKVGDFGLATEEPGKGTGMALRRAQEGTGLAGTPAYMAPEQLDGEPATAASDQFSFAVALYEGIYGSRPFAGANVAEIRAAIARGVAAPAKDDVPARVRAALDRALAAEPARRFGSIDELLAAIDPPARSRRAWIAAPIVVMMGVAAFVMSRGGGTPACKVSSVGGAWDAPRRAAVERAFGAVSRPYAHDALVATERALDAYSSTWAAADLASCEANDAPAIREQKAVCLDELRRELDGFTGLLAAADEDLVRRAPQAAAKLTPPSACAEAIARGRRQPQDLSIRLRVDAAESRLAGARALHIAGRYRDAVNEARAVLAQAKTLGYHPLEADAGLLLGRALTQLGSTDEAERALADAARAAEASRDDVVAADARIERVGALGVAGHDAARGLELVPDAQAALDRLGGDGIRLARLLDYRGSLANLAGHYEEAVALHTQALALRRALLAPDDDAISTSLMDLGSSLDLAGRQREARAIFDDALARRERLLGRSHPAVADILTDRGVVFAEAGDFEHSEADWRRALAIREATLPPDHPAIGALYMNLAADARDQRRYDEAIELFTRAIAIAEQHGLRADAAIRRGEIARTYFEQGRCDDAANALAPALDALAAELGDTHPDVANLLGMSAQIDTCRKRFDAAIATLAKVRAIDEQALGREHPRVASDWEMTGEVYTHEDQDEQAIVAYREALRIKEKALGPDHLDLAATLDNLGDSLAHLRRCGEALPLFQRALAIEEKSYGVTSAHLAFPLRGVGNCLAEIGHADLGRAAYERAIALDGFDELGELAKVMRDELSDLRRPRRAKAPAGP